MISEDTVEQATLDLFKELGYSVANGPSTGPGEPATERNSFSEVVLVERLKAAIARFNTALPAAAQ
jgi:type I restriction enzyme R subunit